MLKEFDNEPVAVQARSHLYSVCIMCTNICLDVDDLKNISSWQRVKDIVPVEVVRLSAFVG